MNEIERKAQALANEVRLERGFAPLPNIYRTNYEIEALCRAIEQHEAFRQEVSDVVGDYFHPLDFPSVFQHFIIPKPKPDPLVEIFNEVDNGPAAWGSPEEYAAKVRAALAARGLEIMEKNDE